jgi:hypothetical protein
LTGSIALTDLGPGGRFHMVMWTDRIGLVTFDELRASRMGKVPS